MKPVHELYDVATDFETLIKLDLENLKESRVKMGEEKDASIIKDILNRTYNLERDAIWYREWAERESEAMEK